MSQETWVKRLDEIKRRFAIDTDDELAAFLGISAPSISKFRAGNNELRPATKLIVLDKLGFAWAAEAMLELIPEVHREQLRRAKEAQTKILIQKRLRAASYAKAAGLDAGRVQVDPLAPEPRPHGKGPTQSGRKAPARAGKTDPKRR